MLQMVKPVATLRRSGTLSQSAPASLTAGKVMTHHVVTVRSSSTVWTEWDLLHGADYRYLVVVDEMRRPVGVLDHARIALEWPPGPLGPHRLRVTELVGDDLVPRVRQDTTMVGVAATMLRSATEALPVVDTVDTVERLIGLVTSRHLINLVARAQ